MNVTGQGRPTLTAALEKLVTRIRGGQAYVIAPEIASASLREEILRRGMSLLLAQWRLRGVKGSRFRFCEARVSIQHRSQLTVGRGTVFEQGSHLRCLSRRGFTFGRGVTVGKYAIIECTGVLSKLGEGVRIGDNSSVGDFSFIGAAGGVTIGRRVLMGQRVSMHAQNHRHPDPSKPISEQGTTEEGILVEDDCWIGSGSIILDGVTIGRGSVVAAGSVVTRSCPPLAILAGVPARQIGSRDVGGPTV